MRFRLVVFLTVAICGSTLNGAAYIKFDGIDGESTSEFFNDFSNALSFSTSVHREFSETNARNSKLVFGDFHIDKNVDSASTEIWKTLVQGEVLPEAQFIATTNAGDQELVIVEWNFENVQMTSYATTGNGDELFESLAFKFDRLGYTYYEYGERGRPIKHTAGWDVEKHIEWNPNARLVMNLAQVPEPSINLASLALIAFLIRKRARK